MTGKIKSRVIIFASIIAASALILVACFVFKNKSPGNNIQQGDADDRTVSFGGVDYLPNEDVSTFLFIGIDSFASEATEKSGNYKQADFILLFVFDKAKKEYRALHINRDTVTDVNVLTIDGSKSGVVKEQIALAHTEGNGKEISCRNTADAVSNLLLGVKVDQYSSFTMDSVAVINDSVGGVTVNIEDDLTSVDPAFKKGETVKLTGDQALSFVRARGGLADATNQKRMSRQRAYMDSLFDALRASADGDREYFKDTFLDLADNVVTNRSLNQLQKIADRLFDYTFAGFVDIKGESKVSHKYMEFYPDRESLEKTVIELFYKKV